MNSRIINSILIFSAAALLTLLALIVKPGSSADSIVILQTSGMTCSSCSATITRVLDKTSGVEASEVDVSGGWVAVAYESATVRPEALADAVTKAGFASNVQTVMSTEEFRRITGRVIGAGVSGKSGCCGSKGCGSIKTEG